ncbi:hypothetical protein NPX13_g3610 [Xylaria arbuscula]|uniref:DUF7708 domain-containing protein n=1 Tax=Xylaria arbuscula TaxID=114810 RepID=A0A9W8NIF0_9PEZI|nr:hypothetical protein NPX13_g3610 [Xylaria arbuscula]
MAGVSDDVRESRRLVRMYSSEVEGRLPPGNKSHVLGQVLSRDKPDPRDINNPWRKFFDPPELSDSERNPITNVITVESNKLLQRWQLFLDSCSDDDRLDVTQSEPTIEGVVDLVKDIITTSRVKNENSRRGKAMKYFHKFCGTVDAHKSILEIIPEGSEYVSVFAGTLNVIIQASVNHERIFEGLSEALCTISEHIADCKIELEIYHINAMMELIADLYAHIFIFLSDVMEWMMQKKKRRVLDSFNEKFYQRFEDQITTIKHKSERIKNLAAQCSRAEQRYTRVALEDLAQDLRLGLTDQRRHEAEMAYSAEMFQRELYECRKERQQRMEDGQKLKLLADQIVKMLENKSMLWIGDSRSIGNERRMLMTETYPPGYPSQLLAASGQRSPMVDNWTSEEVLLSSKHLEDFFHRDRIRLDDDRIGPVGISSGVVRRVSEWMKSATSHFLWLEGPRIVADDASNPVTVLADRIIHLAEENGIPAISYRCELRREESLRPGNQSREAQAMISLICALIRQMIELLLPEFQAKANLSAGRFNDLDGCILSWSESVRLFRDLLPLMPDTLLCVIDGLHWLDERSVTGYLEELLKAMRGSKMRVLFTTTGRSACLRQQLLADETYCVESQDLKGASRSLDYDSRRT